MSDEPAELPSIDLSPLAGCGVPHLDQYFGFWAIEEQRFLAAFERVSSINLKLHVDAAQSAETQEVLAAQGDRSYALLPGGVAVIQLTGPLMKFASSLSGGTSTVAARRAIRNAVADEQVAGILLMIDSPGGTVAGTQDLAADVAYAAKKKPTHAYIEDLGASAAYWVASQAAAISANPTAIVGSIGTYARVEDSSAQAANEGRKVFIVRAGQFKGMGADGTEITAEQLGELQKMVDDLNSHFLAGVAKGRRMPIAAVRSLADGRTYVGENAKTQGLIDSVGSFDQAIANLRSSIAGARKERADMAEPTPKAATYQEIVAACPGISQKDDSQFLCDQLAKGATASAAAAEWVATLKARVEMRDQELAKLKADQAEREKAEAERQRTIAASAAPLKLPGAKPVESAAAAAAQQTASAAGVDQFQAEIDQRIAAGKPRHVAFREACRARPELRAAYVESSNDRRRAA